MACLCMSGLKHELWELLHLISWERADLDKKCVKRLMPYMMYRGPDSTISQRASNIRSLGAVSVPLVHGLKYPWPRHLVSSFGITL